MTDRIAPNPPSPYATADPEYRHMVYEFLGISPADGCLTPTLCDELAVVPDEPLRYSDETRVLPDGMCPRCAAVARGNGIGPDTRPRTECTQCGHTTPYGQLCALCRQDAHDAARTTT
ncbi:hypothetical protein [Embleya hyalina]|uniref:Uncharacterized protein n=1 Tax=Embleya hyalina TaxID=516124 RepID=A0A401YHF3_9ACTN|nr:hypothetical protein [Embleya hyalina]GCD94056.1 hypothetical protein EHYA_01712 [Embleya hyalina]